MRTLRPIFRAALTLVCWATATGAAWAQTETILVPLNQEWGCFLTNAYGPEGNWRTNDYPAETNWQMDVCTFGIGDPAVLAWPINSPFPGPSAGGPLTVYFRTHFQFPDTNSAWVTFVFSNILDDGAVFYLNGREVQRVRMPAGAVSYGSLASSGPPAQGRFERFTVAGANSFVRPGDNVLAVEVHNNSASSVDTLFAGSLSAIFPSPIVITNDLPAEIVAEEGKLVTLSVGVQGSNPFYRWFRNNISAGTTPTLSFGPSTNLQGSQYKVIVTNILNKATSSVAVLTVRQDVYPPGLVSAIAQTSGNSNTIVVSYTENVNPTNAPNVTNYVIRRVGATNRVAISNAVHNGNTVTLTIGGSNWVWGADYILTVSRVTDLNRPRYNPISPLSNQVAVVFPQCLSAFNSTSLCWNVTAANSMNPPAQMPLDWAQLEIDESGPLWTPVVGIAYRDWLSPPALCASLGTGLDNVADITRYFRTRFTAPTNSGKGWLRLRYVSDDGIIFYLNGKEILRELLAPGAIGPSTLATSNGPVVCNDISLALQDLLVGDNILAAEVHNCSVSDDWEVYYGAELTIVSLPDPIVIPAPKLSIAPAADDTIRLDWPTDTGLNWILEAADKPAGGPWAPAASSPPFQTNIVPGTAQFFRLRIPPVP